MKIMYIPVDERPCNTHVVKRIADSAADVELVMPPDRLYGMKKQPADTDGMWEWINRQAPEADSLILSLDMLIYGGLLPSRLHHMSEAGSARWLDRIRSLRARYPHLPVYASNMIMRTPKYSSSDEEPDYYADWGREIFLQAYLQDKQKREPLSPKEAEQLQDILSKLPVKYVNDYETRRRFNLSVNKKILGLAKEGILTFLAIPQDDSAEFGYTAMDQKEVIREREQLKLYGQVQIYPGADEVGATLLARAYNDAKGLTPKIYTFWSSALGPQLIPMYEDRPFAESLKAHILAAGCQEASSPESADLLLAFNTPGRVMQESWDQADKDMTYTSFRHMDMFVSHIKEFIDSGRKVIVADSAYANGGDYELVSRMDETGVLDQLFSYKGWNTNCNTLGSTISQGVMGLAGKPEAIKQNLIYHLLDDYFYQAEIRMEMTNDFLPKHKLTYFDLKDQAGTVNRERDKRLFDCFTDNMANSFSGLQIKSIKTNAPWNRMFECGLHIEVEPVQRRR